MTGIVTEAEGLAALCRRVAAAPRIAIDTEFHNERSYSAHLMVVQIAFEDEVVLLDPLALPDLASLADALQQTVVVGHALSGDLRIFAERFSSLPQKIFDTQVAAAFCGYGVSISLLDLVQAITGTRLRKSQTVSDWSVRPLTERQFEYLVDDVAHLFALHDALQKKLLDNGRLAWAEAEMQPLTDLATFTPDPQRLYMRISGATRLSRRELGILREIAGLRDRLARAKDVPAKYIFTDDVLIGVTTLRPTTVDELSQLRRIDASTRKVFGEELIAAVARALALPEHDLPLRPLRSTPVNRDALVSLLSVITAAIATEHDLPSALLAPRAALERVARDLPKDFEEMGLALEISQWRVDLLAPRLLDALYGRTVLAVEGAAAGSPRIVAIAREE